MTDAVAYLRKLSADPWLVVGKGPTSAIITPDWAKINLAMNVMTLNHACRLMKPDVALFIDLDAYCECRDAGWLKGVPVVMPWYPHVSNRPNPNSLGKYAALGDIFPPGQRVYAFNSTTANTLPPDNSLTTVRVRFFSAVAAFNLLALAGAKEINTLGIDGGTAYNPIFAEKDRLANGRDSFDPQFKEIARTCRQNKIQWNRLK